MVYTLVCTLYTLDDPACIQKVKNKLIEASRIYSKDKETLSWLVMQDVKDPRMFKVVERYQEEGSQKYHLANPYQKTFDPWVMPFLAKPIEVLRHEELDTSKDVEIE
ncbi:hypothetical protein MMC17_004997 [Xylographa soralifera]|nr:hypothetical protein [Xylographa soralifera]